jgi:signal transduction histidine kinase
LINSIIFGHNFSGIKQKTVKDKAIKRNTILLILGVTAGFLFAVTPCYAQETPEDSLKQLLVETSDSVGRKNILMQLARSTRLTDREKSVKYYSEALQYINDPYEKAGVMDSIGYSNWQSGYFHEAEKNYLEALDLFHALKDSLWLGRVMNNLAVVYYAMGNLNEALEFYQKGVQIREATADYKGVTLMQNNIGLVYQDWGLYQDALQWHTNALTLSLKINNNEALAYSYNCLGDYYQKLGEFDAALENYLLGYHYILLDNENNKTNSYLSVSIGDAYSKMGKPDSALIHYQKALTYANRIDNKSRKAIAQHKLGKNYLLIHQTDSASKYINASYRLSQKNHYTEQLRDNQLVLAEMEEQRGNYSKALDYYKSASSLTDSLYKQNEVSKFTELQIRYHQERESRENDLLRKDLEIQKLTIARQKNLRRILIAGTLFILIIMLLILKNSASLKKFNKKLRESEKELLLANANKDKFFTLIAHDLKSPFNGLLGITELMESNMDDFSRKEIKENLQILKESTSKMYALLERLLEWAQIQIRERKYQFKEIDLHEKCLQVMEVLSDQAKHKKIILKNQIKKNLRVCADEKALESVLRNLLSNAVKYTHPGGTVTVDAEPNNHEVLVSVTDTGIGMSRETLDNLFRIDVNQTKLGTHQESGTGLGLILCKEFIEKHGGKIWAESQPGKGSTFLFTLPQRVHPSNGSAFSGIK